MTISSRRPWQTLRFSSLAVLYLIREPVQSFKSSDYGLPASVTEVDSQVGLGGIPRVCFETFIRAKQQKDGQTKLPMDPVKPATGAGSRHPASGLMPTAATVAAGTFQGP